MNVLLIDDNPIDLLINSKIIQSVSPEAVMFKAQSLDQARSYLKSIESDDNESVRLLFVDIRMPVLNGFEMIDAIMEDFSETLKSTTIYMVSSSLDTSDADRVAQTPYIKTLLDKPLTKSVVSDLIKELPKIH